MPGTRRRSGLLQLSILALAALASACQPSPTGLDSTATGVGATPVPTATARPSATAQPGPAQPTDTTGPSASTTPHLIITTLRLELPVALSRSVAFADGGSVLLAGGLMASGTTGSVYQISFTENRVTIVGQLASPVHDAGGALVGGVPTVFGGGSLVAGTVVQRIGAGPGAVVGQLPRPRADLAAIDIGGAAVLVGGGTAARPDAAVLSTTDGRTFRTIATLSVAVRYAAVATIGQSIIVVGGSDGLHDRTEIQAIDPATGSVRVIGHLPHGLSGAAALSIGGRLLVLGGRAGGRAQNTIWEVDPATGAVSLAGRLPRGVSNAAAVSVDGVGYLIGGEGDAFLTSMISITGT